MSEQEDLHPDDEQDAETIKDYEQSDDISADVEPAEPSEIEILRKQIEELGEENSELKNQYLRKQADFENFRKRINREKQESAQYSNQQLLLDLVTIIDDFERAIKSADGSRDYDSFHDGVVIIEKQLAGMLERKWGLSRFESAGKNFNPQWHEAVATEERPGDEASVVLEEYQKGYALYDRVIRPAKVKVSRPIAE